jgi:hypothetical protein
VITLPYQLSGPRPLPAQSLSPTVDPADTLIAFGGTPSPCPEDFACTGNTLSFVHDITDDGFDVGLDILTSATIVIDLTDNFVTTVNNETFSGEAGPQIFICMTGNCVPNPGASVTVTLAPASLALADLATDGMITVTIRSTSGSFSLRTRC